MQMLSRRTVAAALLALVALGGGSYAGYRVWRHYLANAPAAAPKTALVIAAPTSTPTPIADTATPVPAPTPLPASVFVKIPYTSQFPYYGQWASGNPHTEYCEAAALLMVGSYFKGDTRSVLPPAEADTSMGQIVSLERRTFPGVMDLPLTSVGAIGTQLYNLKPTVAPVDPNEIERNLAEGRPVIVPVMTHLDNGAKLAAPYGSLSVYHVILLTGYDRAKGLMYTNDAGITSGQNIAYTWTVLSAAIDAQAHRYPQGRVMLTFTNS
jgi:hypothetical protein